MSRGVMPRLGRSYAVSRGVKPKRDRVVPSQEERTSSLFAPRVGSDDLLPVWVVATGG